MSERPEYVRCVQDADRPGYSVCGRYVFYEFRFEGWEHADASAASGSRLMTCPQCAEKRAEIIREVGP